MYMIIKWPLTGFFAVFEEQMETFSVKSFSNSLYIVTSYYMPTHYHKQQQNTICNRVKKVWQKKRESEFCLFPLLSSLIRQYIASISGIMGNLNSGRIWEIYTYIFFSLHKCDVTFQYHVFSSLSSNLYFPYMSYMASTTENYLDKEISIYLSL